MPKGVPGAALPIETDGDRECGECTGCCYALGVPELKKPADTGCQQCVPRQGCQIYDRRPRSCAAFDCLWLRGRVPYLDRPDRSGVVLAAAPGGGRGVLVALPAWEGALSQFRATFLLGRLAEKQVVIVKEPGKGRILGPKVLVEKVTTFLKRAAAKKAS